MYIGSGGINRNLFVFKAFVFCPSVDILQLLLESAAMPLIK
uniref:Uncharacterized protein n=1 Tax=Anguilla anguilla TaxID=7936 RepID=A0A0E9V3L8_ANGAN